MARISLLFITLFIGVLLAKVESRIATIEDENVEVEVTTEEKPENDLVTKIQELKRKVKGLLEQGKENERAFLGMAEKVRNMDTKVKEMTERLRKINNADYLNAGAENIEKL